MKKKLFGLLIALAFIVGFSQSAYAIAVPGELLTNWYFDTDGGLDPGLTISSAYQMETLMAIASGGTVTVTGGGNLYDPSGYSFLNEGDFLLSALDNEVLPTTSTTLIGGSYSFTGTGLTTGNVSKIDFAALGTLTMKYGVTPVASFFVSEGEGNIDLTPNAGNNNYVSIIYAADQITPGYFFTESGTDMSTMTGLIFGLTTTNFNVLSTSGADIKFSSSGQMKMTVTPVPPALILFGSGLVGFFGISRRKKS